MDNNVKLAAPKWIKLLQAGKLSPESVSRITSAMPEGALRQVKHLGQGQGQVADLVAGNLGNAKGLLVRKLPKYVTNLEQAKLNNVAASDLLNEKFPGLAARYLPTKAKGIFQEYGSGAPFGNNWQGFEQLTANSPITAQLRRMGDFGVRDMHAANFGPKGQLIDYMYRLPSGQVAGHIPSTRRIDFTNQPINKKPYDIKNMQAADATAVRKYWLGNKTAIPGEEELLNSQIIPSGIPGSTPSWKQRILAMPGFKTLTQTMPRLRSLLKTGSDDYFYKLAAKIGPMLSRRGFITGVPKAAPAVAAAAMSNPSAAAKAVASVAAPNLFQRVLADHTNRAKFRIYGSAELPRRDFVKTLPAAVNNNLRVIPEVGVNEITRAADKVGLKKRLQPYIIPGSLAGSAALPAAGYVLGPTVAKIRMPFLSTFNTVRNTLHGNALDTADALSLSAPSVQELPQED